MDNDTNIDTSIQDQLGVPPTPPMPPAGTGPEDSTPELNPTDAMAAELANSAPEPIAPITSGDDKADNNTDNNSADAGSSDAAATLDALVTDTPAPTIGDAPSLSPEAPAADLSAPAGDADLESVKKSMLKDLFPLMDKINVTSAQRFRIYHEMIEDSGDKTLITPAYEAAKGIEDETAKAEALLFLVESADK